MKKELKISELARLWNCSVPTTWNRINSMGLTTFKKKNETNKNISYVNISDEELNQFIINEVNNVNNDVNNLYYEDLLNINNVNKGVNNENDNFIEAEYSRTEQVSANEVIERLTTLNKGYNEDLKGVYERYNEDVKNLYEQLTTYKVSHNLLEDKKASEGFILLENKELKEDIKKKDNIIKGLLTVIIIFIMSLLCFITYFITVNNNVKNSSDITFDEAIRSEISK